MTNQIKHKNIFSSCNEGVNLFSASNNAAAEQAEAEIEELAETIDQSELSERDQSAELVYNFLIPEVLRREQRSHFHQVRNARLEAARSLLYQPEEEKSEETPKE